MHEPALASRPVPEAVPPSASRSPAPRRPPLAASVLIEVPGRVRITPLPPRARLILRGRPAQVEAAGAALGVALPTLPYGTASSGDIDILWLAPDEWLIFGRDGRADELRRTLATALGSKPHAIVDVSHRQAGLAITGPCAGAVLACACPLDLRSSRFPPSACTRTLFGKAEILLWRRTGELFEMEAMRSFSPYLLAFLDQAAREHGAA